MLCEKRHRPKITRIPSWRTFFCFLISRWSRSVTEAKCHVMLDTAHNVPSLHSYMQNARKTRLWQWLKHCPAQPAQPAVMLDAIFVHRLNQQGKKNAPTSNRWRWWWWWKFATPFATFRRQFRTTVPMPDAIARRGELAYFHPPSSRPISLKEGWKEGRPWKQWWTVLPTWQRWLMMQESSKQGRHALKPKNTH